jgi:hypothetical protein
LKIRFLSDANFNQKIVSGLLLREPQIDFRLPTRTIRDGARDPEVLAIGAELGRVVVTHDIRTMTAHFRRFLNARFSPGLIMVPQEMPIGAAIEELLLIWEASDAEELINQEWRIPL